MVLGWSWEVLGGLGEVLGGLGSPLPFQRPRNSSDLISLHPSTSLLKPLLTSLHFSSLFFFRLSSLLSSILAPSWAPFSLNFGPSCLLTPHFFENALFRKSLFSSRKNDIFAPRRVQERPKMALSSLQDDVEELLLSSSFLSSILVRFASHFGCQVGPSLGINIARAADLVGPKTTKMGPGRL